MAALFNDNGSQLSYFATDGSYGDADSMVVVDTADWSNEMWNMIDEGGDYYRGYVAELFDSGATVDEARKLLDKAGSPDVVFINAEIDLTNLRNEEN